MRPWRPAFPARGGCTTCSSPARRWTPGEYKSRGRGLEIRYGLHDGPFGRALLGITERGICWLSFVSDGDDRGAVEDFAAEWPASDLIEDGAATSTAAAGAFRFAMGEGDAPVRLLVFGTNFQIKVWEALLRIPRGGIVSYQDLARALGSPGASRAVGRAVGANPISLLIPCHRVILKSGVVHNYRWGVGRKRAILAIEQALGEAG
jgi:AraC family transcriptional regulator of adaptative response/methylated-DNA-[protein]-cysteine methyltransferase